MSIHAPGCWAWGPGHYDCAIELLQRYRRAHGQLMLEVLKEARDAPMSASTRTRLRLAVAQAMVETTQPREGLTTPDDSMTAVSESGKGGAASAEARPPGDCAGEVTADPEL